MRDEPRGVARINEDRVLEQVPGEQRASRVGFTHAVFGEHGPLRGKRFAVGAGADDRENFRVRRRVDIARSQRSEDVEFNIPLAVCCLIIVGNPIVPARAAAKVARLRVRARYSAGATARS